MSLDEPRNPKHAAMLESDDHPEWKRIAIAQEAAARAARERDELEEWASESIEAEEARWANRFRQSARERPAVHYPTGSG